MRQVLRWFAGRRTVIGFAIATLAANCLIVVTGALVRLTGSGLGCPTWPRCTDESYVTTPEMGWHGVIEFGNRLLTFVLLLIAVGTAASVWLHTSRRLRASNLTTGPMVVPEHRRWALRVLASLLLIGIPFQGVIGGITVLSGLNPFVVALHLMLSAALICAATVLLRRVLGSAKRHVSVLDGRLAQAMFVLAWVAVWLGTVVTGSGPHAGDNGAARTGFDVEFVAKVHAASVWLLVAASVALVIRLRSRAAWALLIAILAQGAIGYLQYALGVPIGLVLLHLIGMTVVMALATNALASVTTRQAVPAQTPAMAAASQQ